MDEISFDKEAAAYAALQQLMQEAQRTKELFEVAQLPAPAPLARMLGAKQGDNGAPSGTVAIPPLEGPTRPRGVNQDSIWVAVNDALSMTLVRACMREFGRPVRPKELVDRITALRPDLGSGGIYNTGPRLEKAGIIVKPEGQWQLVDGDSGPLIQGKHVWGGVEDLQKQEVAAHRRAVIVHLLEVYKGGLQVSQIVERLAQFPQCKAPASKDLVKADMEALAADRRAKRTGGSKKWVAIGSNPAP